MLQTYLMQYQHPQTSMISPNAEMYLDIHHTKVNCLHKPTNSQAHQYHWWSSSYYILSLSVLFFGDFSPLGTQKKKPVQLLQWTFCGEMPQSHQTLRGKKNLKLSYLDNKFQHVAKIYQNFYGFSTFLSDLQPNLVQSSCG